MPRLPNHAGDDTPELVPVFVAGSDLSLGSPQGLQVAASVDDLLADSLFGEIIDISDLIPSLISPATGAGGLAGLGPNLDALPMEGGTDASSLVLHMPALVTLLYDDSDPTPGGVL